MMAKTCLKVTAVCALLAAIAPPIEACSCVRQDHRRTIFPTDATTDFPTDGAVRIFLVAFSPGLRHALPNEYRLVDEAGVHVETESRVVGTRLDLIPKEPLLANTLYTLEQIFVYGPDGGRLTDAQRWKTVHEPNELVLKGAWFPISSFQTGSVSLKSPPLTPVIRESKVSVGTKGNCGPSRTLGVSLELPPGGNETDFLELQIKGQGTVSTVPITYPLVRMWAGQSRCSVDPVSISTGPDMQIRLVWLDTAGNQRGTSGWQPVPGMEEKPTHRGWIPSPDLDLDLDEEEEQWFNIERVPVTEANQLGPDQCPYGFEEVLPIEALNDPATNIYSWVTSLSTSLGPGWLALPGKDRSTDLIRLQTFQRGVPPMDLSTRLRGLPQRLSIGEKGPYLILTEFVDNEFKTSFQALANDDGRTLWSRVLPSGVDDYRVVTGGGRVVVYWGLENQPDSESLAWSMFDEDTGELVAEGVIPNVHHPGEGPVMTFVLDHFLAVGTAHAHEEPGRLTTARLQTDGTVQPQESPPTSPTGSDYLGSPDVTSAGLNAGFVNVHKGDIHWRMLDSMGNVLKGPVEVSPNIGANENRNPRIAWNNHLFAVVWQSFGESHVAAVNEEGVVSPATRLGRPKDGPYHVEVDVLDGEFVILLAHNNRAVLSQLRCRTSPSRSAPQQIRF